MKKKEKENENAKEKPTTKKRVSKKSTRDLPWWDDPEINECAETRPLVVEKKWLKRKSYSDSLQDPRWQKKRLEVFQRDNWTCQLCGSGLNDGTPLNIHHRTYHLGKKAWEYDDKDLLTICEKCHSKLHNK